MDEVERNERLKQINKISSYNRQEARDFGTKYDYASKKEDRANEFTSYLHEKVSCFLTAAPSDLERHMTTTSSHKV